MYLFLILYVNTPVFFSLSIFLGIDPQHHIFIENIVCKRYLLSLYLKNALFKNLKYCVVVELSPPLLRRGDSGNYVVVVQNYVVGRENYTT
jgi:hypothetical protein